MTIDFYFKVYSSHAVIFIIVKYDLVQVIKSLDERKEGRSSGFELQ